MQENPRMIKITNSFGNEVMANIEDVEKIVALGGKLEDKNSQKEYETYLKENKTKEEVQSILASLTKPAPAKTAGDEEHNIK